MLDIIWATPYKKRQEFDESFSRLVNSFIPSYTGGQPVIAWHSDKMQPVIHPEFLDHLPDYVRREVEKLLNQLNGENSPT